MNEDRMYSMRTMSTETVEYKPDMIERVCHPSHYNHGKIEVIDFIEDQELGFPLGNAVKYICRCRWKDNMLEDLKKARWYIDWVIKELEDDEQTDD